MTGADWANALLLTIDSDGPQYNACVNMARMALWKGHERETHVNGTLTLDEAVLFTCADAMKEHYEKLLDDPAPRTKDFYGRDVLTESQRLLIAQIVGYAVAEVDWHVLARHYLDKLKEWGERATAGL